MRGVGFRWNLCYDDAGLREEMETAIRVRGKIPEWVRWLALLWLVVWVPVYWHAWGAGNFLHLCDVAVILACIGLWTGNALLLSSQAISSVVIDALWTLDVVTGLLFRRHFIGGTEYLFDGTMPLWIRLLSLFHIVMPFVLVWSLSRLGYDRRGFALQAAIALPVVIASRFVTPAQNLNFAQTAPFFHRQLGPAPVHLTITYLAVVLGVYSPTHVVFRRWFRPPEERGHRHSAKRVM
ncbi:MAG: hypothetical protein WBY66_24035 [Candidatus Acidiferrales bacterium]